ncbi:glycosyltransferase [Shewanella sp. C32]|uniref:Glycosyltransferase n=1 Tax=Shewanella electrica TaxID=515560 RepID=A0ABT2FPE6_9GAMM|nr:glycosyltransferase [Shewanella electrica]MCH1926460.1 glycosyltransferase [Shewanella electrica]MCS4557916.1 glycosyltransferase [Shewanella electrica]
MTAKLRLLWLTQHYPPAAGGMALSCDRIVRHLRAQGVHITLYHLKHASPHKTTFYSDELGCDYRVGLADNPAHGLNLLWHEIAEQTFDAVVGYGFPWALHGARIFAAWKQLPLLTCIRGNDFDVNILDARRSANLLDILSASRLVLTVSQDKATRIKALLPAVNVANMGNGIDLSQWQPLPFDQQQASSWREQRQLNSATKVIGLIGHLKDKKGCAFFISTLQRLRLLERDVHLLLVGDIDNATAQLLDSLPPQSWSHEPVLDRYQLPARYLACDLIAIPSFYDGTPNVLLEAAALGIAVLGARCGGMADILTPDNGWLFTPNDSDSLSQALTHWQASSPTEVSLKASRLQQLIFEQYQAEHEARRYIKLIEETIAPLPGR